jgi:hypothetical protein
MKNCSPTGKLIDKASKKALKKTSPPFQCRAKGGFMSINRCRMVSAFMADLGCRGILPVRGGAWRREARSPQINDVFR